MLTFKDGMIVDYGCGGCGSQEAGKAYVKEHLLQGRDTLPMGEFAIGSNTLAYAIARDMDLVPRMPILLAEKMGPILPWVIPALPGERTRRSITCTTTRK